ncbi:hypothetical protein [Arthrobacter sp. FW306-06-A]|uniref:hypothetical protein n=1 Tax=Arthrobacter sp. FW306-06-A TaxID=2879621 RepID=UPI001F233D58|nr:hypothetical protein [Arthrobacter sp. FW306-06-A]UKA71124.1 hypothetical protein LFT49_20850 [Arthrobacter sp. FW306-06-A]
MKRTLATLGVVGLGLISLTAPALAAGDKVIVCHSDGSTWAPLEFSINALGGHDQHPLDIIPPTSKSEGKNWTAAGKELYAAQCAPLPPGEVPAPVVTPPAEQPPVVVVTPVTPPPTEEPTVTPPPTEEPTVTPPPTEVPITVDQPVVQPPAVVVPPAVEQPAAETPAVQSPEVKSPVVAAQVPAQPAPAKQAAAAAKAAPKAAPAPVSVGTNQGYNAQTAVGASDGGQGWLAGVGALAAAGAAVAARRRSRPLNNAG